MTDTKPPSAEAMEFVRRFKFSWDDDAVARYVDAFAERRAAEARREGHNEPCYYCSEPCNDLAGDPGEWSIGLSHPDEPGLVKYHHTRCIFVRLRPDPLTAAEDKARRAAIEECKKAVRDELYKRNKRREDFRISDVLLAIDRALADKPAAGKGEP